MGVVFMIVAGAVTGWLAAFLARAERLPRGVQLNILAGVAGALLAGMVVAPLLGVGDLVGGHYSVAALLVSILGSVLTLALLNLLHRRISG